MAKTYSEGWLKLAYAAYETRQALPSSEIGFRETLLDFASDALKKAVGERRWNYFISVCLLAAEAGTDFEAFKSALAILGWLPEEVE